MKLKWRHLAVRTGYGLAFCLAFALCFFTACAPKPPDEIRIGGIFDFTGSTHEICIPCTKGILAYIDYANSKGGINGRQVKIFYEDYGYIVPKAKTLYDKFVNRNHVKMIFGWGTGDTEYLREFVAKDKIPYTAASYSQILGNPEQSPYNFIVGVSYSTQICIALKYIKQQWANPDRPPRVALVYNDTRFGLAPIPKARQYAKEHNIEIVTEQIVSLTAREATQQIEQIRQSKADFVVMQQSTWAASVVLRAAYNAGLEIPFIGLNWCSDEKLISLAGKAAEGFTGLFPFVYSPHSNTTEMKQITNYLFQTGIQIDANAIRFVQGWAMAQVMLAGIEKAGNDLTGKGIKKGLESLVKYDTGGITAPITFTSYNHCGTRELKIGKVKNGKWEINENYISA